MPDTHRDGPSAAMNPNPNQQHDGKRGNQQQNLAKMHQSHGHAFLLATQPRSPKSIQNLLATRADKSRGLLY